MSKAASRLEARQKPACNCLRAAVSSRLPTNKLPWIGISVEVPRLEQICLGSQAYMRSQSTPRLSSGQLWFSQDLTILVSWPVLAILRGKGAVITL